MQIDSLLTDSVFQLIEREYIKRSKKRAGTLGEQDYKVALQALVDRIFEITNAKPVATSFPQPISEATKVRIAKAASILTDSPAPATPEELEEMNRRDAINKVDADKARNEKLVKVAEAVRRVFEQGGNRVQVPKDMVVSEIEPFLKSQGIHFSSLQIGLPATEPGSPARYWNLTFER